MKGKKLLKAAAVTAGIATAASGFVHYEVLNKNGKIFKIVAKKKFEDEIDKRRMFEDTDNVRWADNVEFEKFTIINDRGQNIRAFYVPAEKPSDVFVLFSHGYRSTHMSEFKFQMKYFHDKGYNIFLVDHQASGESDGTQITFGHHESVDLLTWIDFMKDAFGEDIQIILYGISMGSATVMMTSGMDELPDNVKCTIADCGYTSMLDEFDFNLKGMIGFSKPVLKAVNLVNKVVAKYDFGDVSPAESVKNAKVPILFIHGADDDFVPTYMVCTLYNNCTSEKDLLIVEDAKHAESYQTNPKLYESKVDEFTAKYIK